MNISAFSRGQLLEMVIEIRLWKSFPKTNFEGMAFFMPPLNKYKDYGVPFETILAKINDGLLSSNQAKQP